jgi:ABC-type multidrug transport system ATPase subunit
MKGRTTFIIAQRLNSVQNADQILVLQEGEIVERGVHDELLELDGHYAEIYRLQLADQERVRRELIRLGQLPDYDRHEDAHLSTEELRQLIDRASGD